MKKVCSRCKDRKDSEKDFPIRKYGDRIYIEARCFDCNRELCKLRVKKLRDRRRLTVTSLRPA